MKNTKPTEPDPKALEEEIIRKLRERDPETTRDFFYATCRIAYHIYNKRYELEGKAGLDFYSIAHEYYLALARHDFRQLEDRRPDTSLKTWMINGFRYVLLDRLKAFNKEHRLQPFEERLETANLSFDLPDNNFTADFRNTVDEICSNMLGRDSRQSLILQMMLIDGYKGKEVAAELGITPSAVTQQYHKLLENVVRPYFKAYYEAPSMAESGVCYSVKPKRELQAERRPILPPKRAPQAEKRSFLKRLFTRRKDMNRDFSNRITPNLIESLRPGEIFVFGSNLAGMHGGGAARAAHLHFGAVLGNGDGPQGQSYAIPTMQGGVETIKPYVDKFIEYAKKHTAETFLVTPIGCGIAGFSPQDIAPLFADAVDVPNVHLPQSFWNLLL